VLTIVLAPEVEMGSVMGSVHIMILNPVLTRANSASQTSMTKMVGQLVGLPGAPKAVFPTSVGYLRSLNT
jgi:hypothetical protein